MIRFCLGLAGLCLLSAAALADGLPADGVKSDCGGDAYSFAEVAPAGRGMRRQRPLIVMPDTLCADLASSPGARIDSLSVFVDTRRPADEQSPQTDLLRKPMAPFRRH